MKTTVSTSYTLTNEDELIVVNQPHIKGASLTNLSPDGFRIDITPTHISQLLRAVEILLDYADGKQAMETFDTLRKLTREIYPS